MRIAVNDELGVGARMPAARASDPGGVWPIISYHSGEDRLVKNAFRDWSAACSARPGRSSAHRGAPLGETLTKRPVSASEEEIEVNSRARSALARLAFRGRRGVMARRVVRSVRSRGAR